MPFRLDISTNSITFYSLVIPSKCLVEMGVAPPSWLMDVLIGGGLNLLAPLCDMAATSAWLELIISKAISDRLIS